MWDYLFTYNPCLHFVEWTHMHLSSVLLAVTLFMGKTYKKNYEKNKKWEIMPFLWYIFLLQHL